MSDLFEVPAPAMSERTFQRRRTHLLAELERAAAHPLRRFRPVLAVAVAVIALAAIGAGVAAATGVLPWLQRVQALRASPFFTATDPATVPGSIVSLSVPGPESTTFEVVTNNTVIAGTVQEHCMAIIAKNAQGQSGRGLTGCGTHGAAAAIGGGSFDWQAPSGAMYAVISGPTPVSTAVKVALLDSNGGTATTEPVEGGYYLVYVRADLATSNLVFYNARGKMVAELGSPHP